MRVRLLCYAVVFLVLFVAQQVEWSFILLTAITLAESVGILVKLRDLTSRNGSAALGMPFVLAGLSLVCFPERPPREVRTHSHVGHVEAVLAMREPLW